MDKKALSKFLDRYQHAHQTALETHFDGGTCGLELEWNVIDSALRPVHHVGSGPDAVSFADELRRRFIAGPLIDRNELEVFHWMTEWTTRPYYHAQGAVYEGRLLEACMLNALSAAGLSFGERLYAWPGNLLWPVEVNGRSIPGEWELAKRRYLEHCVELFGSALATAGMHTNVSLPVPLLSLDYLHLPAAVRVTSTLRDYCNEVNIRGARILRAFAAVFVATSAASPLRPERAGGEPALRVTDEDSNRLLVFPNPPALDVADLYRSHADYVRISSDLVRSRVRFGNNNWTPTRARSDRKSVDRIIHITTEQLHDVYRKGIYRVGESESVDSMTSRIEIENLLARVEIPMARVEIRCDEGGHDLDVDVANLVLRELLLIRTYADPGFGAGFAYSAADIDRCRKNEDAAARLGLRGEIEHPFTGAKTGMREFLAWALGEVNELAAGLGRADLLDPLRAMATGGPNTAEQLRQRVRRDTSADNRVPFELLKQLAVEREEQVDRDVERIVGTVHDLRDEAPKLREMLTRAREAARLDPTSRFHFEEPGAAAAIVSFPDKTAEILDLAKRLIRIPSVTNCPNERLEEVYRAGRFIAAFLRDAGLDVHLYDDDTYPAVLAAFPGQLSAPVMLSGHFDVVEPSPDDGQFEPVIDGDYLWGRGSADMKTVVATYLIWMRDRMRRGGAMPPINMLLVGNEENGEREPTGTPHVLAALREKRGYEPQLMVVGERTGEKDGQLYGDICIENRGVIRVSLVGSGRQEHTGVGAKMDDLLLKLDRARLAVAEIADEFLTLKADDNWVSEYRFAFINVGTTGVYNITPSEGHLGLEIRPIPQDNIAEMLSRIRNLARALELELRVETCEPGVACDRDNPHLARLIEAVRVTSGQEPVIARKKPGTSGRFAPNGQAIIWGQSGQGPHSPAERHYIPSILPHCTALDRFADLLL